MAFNRKKMFGLQSILDSLRNALLPSGAIVWFGNRTTAPDGWAICDGTNGTPNLIGRYPLGATSGVGNTVEAGLPNITGVFGGSIYGGVTYPNGPFVSWVSGDARGSGRSGGALGKVTFNASNASAVYGKSTTVTPPSTKLLPCMKL